MSELVKCPYCNKEIEADSHFCDQCGSELMKCTCSKEFRKGKICTKCGKPLVPAKDSMRPAEGGSVDVRQDHSPQRAAADAGSPIDALSKRPDVSGTGAADADSPKDAPSRRNASGKLTGKNVKAELELIDGAVIGRKKGDFVNVFGSCPYVSGSHARFHKGSNGDWEIEDLDSTNGTFINGRKIAPNHPESLTKGDEIAFYDIVFIFN